MHKTATLFLAALICYQAQAANNDTWPTWQGNSAHTGYANVTVDYTAIKTLWTRVIPEASDYIGEPIATGETIYVASGDDTKHLFALNTINGETKWKVDFAPGTFLSALTYNDNKIYLYQFQQGDYNTFTVKSFDAATGNVDWMTPVNMRRSSLIQAPIVDNHQLFVGNQSEEISLNADNGNVLWKAGNLGGFDMIAVNATYALRTKNNMISLLNRQNGEKIADIKAVTDTQSNIYFPLVYDENNHNAFSVSFYKTDDHWATWVTATNIDNRHINWELNFPSYADPLAFANNTIYLASYEAGDNGNTLNAINALTGQINWKITLTSPAIPFGPPIVTNNAIIVPEYNNIDIISLDKHAVMKSIPVQNDGGEGTDIAVAKNVLYYVEKGRITAVALN